MERHFPLKSSCAGHGQLERPVFAVVVVVGNGTILPGLASARPLLSTQAFIFAGCRHRGHSTAAPAGLCLVFDASPLYSTVAPFASFDQLGCGALLALCAKDMVSKTVQSRIHWLGLGHICVPAFVLLLIGKSVNFNPTGSSIYIGTIASFAFIQLIQCTTTGFSGWAKVIFENPLLSQMGKMSYSVFLLHNFTELLVPKIGILKPLLESNYKGLLLIPLTALLAHVAWRMIENPILSFRRKYAVTAKPASCLCASGECP